MSLVVETRPPRIACEARVEQYIGVVSYDFVIVFHVFFVENMPSRIANESRAPRVGAFRARPRALRALRTQLAPKVKVTRAASVEQVFRTGTHDDNAPYRREIPK